MNEKKTWRKPIIDYKYFFKEEWENFISINRKERKKRQKSNN